MGACYGVSRKQSKPMDSTETESMLNIAVSIYFLFFGVHKLQPV